MSRVISDENTDRGTIGVEFDENIDEDEQFDIEEAGYIEDQEDDEEEFEREYDRIFEGESDTQVEEDVEMIEKELITGKRMRKPRMAVLNKTSLSQQEMDELFLSSQ